jgi:internalin A
MTKLLPYMGNFTKMRELRLSWNEIEELPVQVFFHSPIQSNSFLAKCSNTDKNVDMQVARLKSLTCLMLDHNKIVYVHPALGRLSNLTKLSFSHNCIDELPTEFFDLTNLETLALDHNQFAVLSGALSSCIRLTDLRLSHNQLKSIPESIGTMRLLKRLSIGHNPFRRVPDVLTSLKSLEELWISELNSYDVDGFLPEYFDQLTNLRTLHIDDDDRRNLPPVVTKRGIDSIIGDFIILSAAFLSCVNM